ncbi:MAG TPA: DUF1385 domain-containing protein [Terriglobales bacterium]|nr:DUF1385 domain-containing protein [Terriglobales bacterium]
MHSLLRHLKFLAAVQLLPALESGEETVLVGGQAVLEGVMMRSPHAWGICIRRPDGSLATHSAPLEKLSDKHKWMGWPLVRGLMTLGQAMALGFRALRYSANVAMEQLDPEKAKPEEKSEISGWVIAVNLIVSLGFFIFLYKFVPLVAATKLKNHYPAFGNQIAFNVVDGVVRIALFLLFIWGISLWADIRRVYQYHGAEHKTVFAFEHNDPLTVQNAQKYVTWHPRCGTSFLMTVMLIAMFIYMLVPAVTFWGRFAARLALLPVIVAVSYEMVRFAAKHGTSLFALLTKPGLWLQRITTQPPSDDQVETAIAALNEAMELEKQRGGELVIA